MRKELNLRLQMLLTGILAIALITSCTFRDDSRTIHVCVDRDQDGECGEGDIPVSGVEVVFQGGYVEKSSMTGRIVGPDQDYEHAVADQQAVYRDENGVERLACLSNEVDGISGNELNDVNENTHSITYLAGACNFTIPNSVET